MRTVRPISPSRLVILSSTSLAGTRSELALQPLGAGFGHFHGSVLTSLRQFGLAPIWTAPE